MRKKGFTLIELLVVIAIIAMLLAILMPALGKVKKLAERLVCGTNIKGLVTSMVLYSNDSDNNYPRQGGPSAPSIHDFAPITSDWHLTKKDWPSGGTISVGASLFLLVRYADVGTKSFVCRGGNETPYDGDNPDTLNTSPAVEELWDFGGAPTVDYGQPRVHVSYAYQRPYPDNAGLTSFPGSTSNKTERAIIADKNPYWEEELDFSTIDALDQESYVDAVALIGWDVGVEDEVTGFFKWHVKVGNSAVHEREGQNVGYGDGHVTFERRPDVGVQNDNIYLPFAGSAPFSENWRRKGGKAFRASSITDGVSKSSRDAFLINDGTCDDTPNTEF